VTIAIVGKYVDLKEAYKSLHEALVHGGVANDVGRPLTYTSTPRRSPPRTLPRSCEGSTALSSPAASAPGEWKARSRPSLCPGEQDALFRHLPWHAVRGHRIRPQHVLGLTKANSEEFDLVTPDPVIYLMTEWYDFRKNCVERRDETSDKGGTMRLGAYPCVIARTPKAFEAYGRIAGGGTAPPPLRIQQLLLRAASMEAGLTISGLSPDEALVEIVEIKDHPWFLGCQFHPEFKSTPMRPHPLFREFIRAAVANKGKPMPEHGDRGPVAASRTSPFVIAGPCALESRNSP
jgi:CTP synthase